MPAVERSTWRPADLERGSAGPLTLSVLGEIEVTRGGKALALPPSRKARALLVYLALTARPHRRERLCAMFWDTPDDPRGALRSTLSKLRAVVDGPDRRRIVATREAVRFDATGMEIDLLTARRRLVGDLGALPTRTLEQAAGLFRGDFAEGLELDHCPEFQAWRVAEREEARRLRARVLSVLVERYPERPESALAHARTLVQVDPDALAAHATLLRLLIAGGRRREAEEQLDVSRRVLARIDDGAARALTRIWQSLIAGPERAAPAAGAIAATPSASSAALPDALAAPRRLDEAREILARLLDLEPDLVLSVLRESARRLQEAQAFPHHAAAIASISTSQTSSKIPAMTTVRAVSRPPSTSFRTARFASA